MRRVACAGQGAQPRPRADELKAVWHACGQLNEPWPGLFRLLIASGRRRGEMAGMKWEHLDIDKGWWTIPPELARNGRPHALPLAPLMDIIGKRRVAAGEPTAGYVFAHARSRGRAPVWVLRRQGTAREAVGRDRVARA